MLNISHNQLNKKVSLEKYFAYSKAFKQRHYKHFNRFLFGFLGLFCIILFLPWTQNVTGNGYVTTLTPDQRPQTIQSVIPGRIEKWYVREGDFVKKGDTLLHISEINNTYQDPQLVSRTQAQQLAKTNAVQSYQNKVLALDKQIKALAKEQELKLKQAQNSLQQAILKVESDSIDLEAARIKYTIATRQYNRTDTLQKEGIKAVTDVEEKREKLQAATAKLIAQENALLASQNDVLNAEIEIARLTAYYNNLIAKTNSERFTAQSNQFDTEAQVSKLENQTSNYQIRSKLYYITAPLDGYVNKALRTGIGETFDKGEKLMGIMPAHYDLAIETYVAPIDLPLIHLGEQVRVQFDGWPAIIFSGWPNVSVGTYAGQVVAIESFISENGKFRILIAPNPQETPWPKNLRVGSGAFTMALLDDVPIWFEIWRQLNGFPPNYYTPENNANTPDTSKK